MNPFSMLTQPATIPPWRGATREFRLLDRAPRVTIKIQRKKATRHQRSMRPWTLLSPGSAMERAILALAPGYFWKSPAGAAPRMRRPGQLTDQEHTATE